MKKILILFFSILMLVVSFNVKANEKQDDFKLENEDYVYDEELEEEIKEEYKQYVIIGDESISIDYDLIEQTSVDYDIIHKIEDNISVVNEFAQIQGTYINEYGEIIFNTEEIERLKICSFKISWSGIKFILDNETSIMMGTFGILYNLYCFGQGTIDSYKSFLKICDNDYLASIIVDTLLYLPSYGISNVICEIIENNIANIIPIVISFNLTVMTIEATSVVTGTGLIYLFIKTLFDCYISMHIPSISDCAKVLYKSINNGLCANINVGWFKTTIKMV